MAKSKTVTEIKKLIAQLTAERQEAQDKIAEIDQVFASLGLGNVPSVTAAPVRRGRKPGPKPGRKAASAGAKKKTTGRRRGSFGISGEQSVLEFVTQAGTPSTREVNVHWTNEGRAGKADNALGKLVREGKLKRIQQKGERGSRYEVAA